MDKQDHGSMGCVLVAKSKLLQKLKENKEKHNVIYEVAVSGYYKEIQRELDKKISMATRLIDEYEKKKTQVIEKNVFSSTFKYTFSTNTFNARFPENHLYDYDKAIQMLEFSSHDAFSLTNQEFDQYVMNNWAWRASFMTNNMPYVTGYCGPKGVKGIPGSVGINIGNKFVSSEDLSDITESF